MATALSEILGTGLKPAGLLDYAILALKSPEAPLLQLAAQQIGLLIVVSFRLFYSAVPTDSQVNIAIDCLVLCLSKCFISKEAYCSGPS